MKGKILTGILILMVVSPNTSYPCPNIPPDVTITAPSGGDSFTEGDDITIEAYAFDQGGYVTKVEFYQGLTKLGEDTSEPYSCLWFDVSPGSYTLKARAYDNLGEWTDSETVDIIVGNIWYVDKDATGACDGQSWGDAYNYPQDALAVSAAGDEIRVAEGVYRPDVDSLHPDGTGYRSTTFQLKNKVVIKGGYAGFGESNPDTRNIAAYETVLSGNIGSEVDDWDNSYHVVSADETVIDNSTVLDGFTITGGNAYYYCTVSYGGGLLVLGEEGSEPNPTVVNCVFRNNKAYDGGGGIYCSNASPTITMCFFINNTVSSVSSYGGGLSNYLSDTRVINCIFSGNTAEYGGGIGNTSSSPALTNCTFRGNSAGQYGGGIYNEDSSTSTLTNCILWGDVGGEIYNETGSSATVNYCDVQGGLAGGEGNINVDPRFVEADYPAGLDGVFGTSDDGLYLQPDSPYNCIDTGHERDVDYPDVPDDDITGYARPADGDHSGSAEVDMGAYEVVPVWYVKDDATGTNDGTSWTNARNYLQDALVNDAAEGDEIWVAGGSYRPDQGGGKTLNDRTATFDLRNRVSIYGGFEGTEHSRAWRDWTENKTILSGDLLGDDVDVPPEELRTEPSRDENSYHVVTGSGTDATAVLDGFTITGGNGHSFGGGVYNNAGSPTLTNCTLTGNSANLAGGGLYNTYSNPTLTNCTVSGNAATFGGGLINLESSPLVANCVFCGNYAISRGGGMYNYQSWPKLTNCTFSGNNSNEGGGICNSNAYPEIINCIIWGNTAVSEASIYNINSYNLDDDPSLIAWWKFDDGEGDTASDSVGGYDGTLIGDPQWVKGKIGVGGHALDFDGAGDGVDSYGSYGHNSPLNIYNSDLTISAWIKIRGSGTIVARAQPSYITYRLGVAGGKAYINTYRMFYGHWILYGDEILDLNTWYHIVGVFDRAGDKGYVYVNGIQRADGTMTIDPYSNDATTKIGCRNNPSDQPFRGVIDDVRIYNRSLTEEEVGWLSGLIRCSNIEGCGGSGKWDASLGTDGGGNLDEDPHFANSDNPAGTDGFFGTSDDGMRLKLISRCIDAADGDAAQDTDMCGDERADMDFVLNIGVGNPNYADIGAYEYDSPPGYITSFEQYQGYDWSTTIDGTDGWEVEEGSAYVDDAEYKEKNGEEIDEYPYQYVDIYNANRNSTISYGTVDSCEKTFIRVSCIPSSGSLINVMDGSSLIASIKFGEDGGEEDGKIYVWDDGSYIEALTDPHYYDDIATQCRDFLSNPYPYYYYGDGTDYSYENTWMEFVIEFDFENHTYDVTWAHYEVPDGESIYTGAGFDSFHRCYTTVEFKVGTGGTGFKLNSMSISDMALPGGVVGADEDVWLTEPEADILNPLKGQCIVAGTMWYDTLGEYVVKCCPSDLDSADPGNWIQVCSGQSISKELIFLGFWNTEGYFNGDYFLKIEIYDDLRRLISEGIIEIERTFNGRSKTCNVRYPVIGRAKPRTYHYEEIPDFTINWPGTFPFEFKRTYNNGLRARIYPLFFGWIHNHNIRLIEDSQYDWIMDVEEDYKPARDDNGLGIGRLWLCQPLGGQMFIGHVNDVDPEQVIYEPLDNENHYIIRTSSVDETNPDEPVFTLEYVYYTPDGMKMTFQKQLTVYYPVPALEGLVDWIVVAGINKQADRFNNALVYEWSGLSEEDGNDVFLNKIWNNRTNANLRFTYQPGTPDGPLEEVRLYNDDAPTDAYVNFVWYFPSSGDPDYYSRTWGGNEGSSGSESVYLYSVVGQDFMLTYMSPTRSILRYENYDIFVKYNDDGTLIERQEDLFYGQIGGNGFYSSYQPIEQYNYEYDNKENLITTIKVKSGNDSWLTMLREEVTVTSPEGAMLIKDVRTFHSGNQFDPYDYYDYSTDWDPDPTGGFRYHAGGGGAADTEYFYENANFPFKPTTIIEYYDDDGDGEYDRPSKKTTMQYDGRGNLTDQKVYVDSEYYVYTKYDYHQDYDFPIRQTTWQGYCYDEGDIIVTSGAKVEKQWLYGDADGTLVAEGKRGDFLVQESVLLNDTGPEWADTFYTYESEGQIKTKEDPKGNITYYTYDSYGFRSKEWQGAHFEGGLPVGNSQKRYYYDELGRKRLEADYLGKVQMNVYDSLGRVAQARIYKDEDVMEKTDEEFVPSTYDAFPNDDEFNDWWESRTLYNDYYAGNNPYEIILPTGGSDEYSSIRHRNGRSPYVHNFGDESERFRYDLAADDGRILNECRFADNTYDDVGINHIYDSMRRLIHKYSYFDHLEVFGPFKYIKHEEFQYDASGNKIYEAVYSVERGKFDFAPDSGVLEKANSYEYDILGRLTKQVVDCTDGGLNQTTEYGYDAVGNRIYIIDPSGNIIFTDYDNANRKICSYFAAAPVYVPGTDEIDFAATKANAIVKKAVTYYKNDDIKDASSYDYDSSLLAYTEYLYDSRGRLDTVTEQVNDTQDASTSYYYSDDGDLERVVGDSGYHNIIQDAEGKRTGIKLSYHGKTEKATYPSGDYEEYRYYDEDPFDQNNDPIPVSMFNGLLEQKAVWDGSSPDPDYINYEYDDFGKVKTITYPDEGYLEYDYTARTLGKYGKVEQITDNRNADDRPGAEGSKFTFDYWYLSGNVKTYEDYEGDEENKGYTVHYDYLRAYDQPTVVHVNDLDDELIYHVEYSYDLAGRLIDVCEPLLPEDYQLIAGFDYDDNGNRSQLTYYRNGSATGPTTSIGYGYNLDNLLTAFTTTGGPTFTFDATDSGDIDGLGRLKNADETITKTSGTVSHSYTFDYDMRSQLTQGTITNIDSSLWKVDYSYKLDGNVQDKTIDDEKTTEYEYDSDLMTSASSTTGGENFDLDWDLNGQMTNLPYSGITTQLVWNWDGKLRSGTKGTDTIELRYDPLGNRVSKTVNESERKYIIDISGKLPVILMELNNSGGIEKTYIYANSQIIAQHTGDHTADRYFYLHDRLGSVRQVIDNSGSLENSYTFDPFGEVLESDSDQGAPGNSFMFTGQYFDSEIEEYYLRARQYDPHIARFTSRDPVRGKFKKPLTLHVYLYCLNDPVNKMDPKGEVAVLLGGSLSVNCTAADLGSLFMPRSGLGGIGAMAAYYSVILPSRVTLIDIYGVGVTGGAGFVGAWDHTKHLNDKNAWSWGTMQWVAGGPSVNTGLGGSITVDIGVSNAKHVSQLAGPFAEFGGSGLTPLYGLTMGLTVARGVNPDGSWNDIWLGTYSVGYGSPGIEGHSYVGIAAVQENAGFY